MRAGSDRRYLTATLVLLVVFMAVEVTLGIVSGSLVLVTDAGHMLTDAASIGLALVAIRLAAQPARGAYTYGLKRAEILSAQANGITLALLVAFFAFEGVRRLLHPRPVEGGVVALTAVTGILVNLVATWLLSRADRRSLNVEGAFQHLLSDLFAFAATLIAGIVVVTTGWRQADAVAALVVAALMARAAYGLLRDSARIFLEAAPRGVDPEALASALLAVPGVTGVHELHVWEVTSGFPALSAHVLVDGSQDCHAKRGEVERLLLERFEIDHTTLQVDHRDDVVAVTSLGSRLRPEIDDQDHPGH